MYDYYFIIIIKWKCREWFDVIEKKPNNKNKSQEKGKNHIENVKTEKKSFHRNRQRHKANAIWEEKKTQQFATTKVSSIPKAREQKVMEIWATANSIDSTTKINT